MEGRGSERRRRLQAGGRGKPRWGAGGLVSAVASRRRTGPSQGQSVQPVGVGVGCAGRGLGAGAALACFRTAGKERANGYAKLHAPEAFPCSPLWRKVGLKTPWVSREVTSGFTKVREPAEGRRRKVVARRGRQFP